MILKTCLACGSQHLKQIIDLGDQPLANSYLHSPDELEQTFPLKLMFCESCTHLQLSDSVEPNLLFKNYLYVSGTSQTGLDHFKWFVNFTKQYVHNAKTVLDIACNDGTQLNYFADCGYKTYGIDPAENLLPLSSIKSQVICDYLNQQNINSFQTKFDIILAQNVFAHVNYPDEFLIHSKSVLSENGVIFVQTSQANMVFNNEFDTIYHEHLSFFSVSSMCSIAKRVGLNVIDIKRVPIHGTSFIFVLSANGIDNSAELIKKEQSLNLNMLDEYVKNIQTVITDLKTCIDDFRQQKYLIVGYGAAAKGNTLLNYSKISLDFIVDDNKLKHQLYTPGMRIPILSPDVLKNISQPILIIPLAWNFFDEIKGKVEKHLKHPAKYLKYFPKLTII